MNYTTIAQYLNDPEATEAIAQLKRFSVKQLAAIYNHVVDNPDEPNHNFSVSKQEKPEPTAFLSAVLSEEILTLDLNPKNYLLVSPQIIEAIRAVEAERDRIWKNCLTRATMSQTATQEA